MLLPGNGAKPLAHLYTPTHMQQWGSTGVEKQSTDAPQLYAEEMWDLGVMQTVPEALGGAAQAPGFRAGAGHHRAGTGSKRLEEMEDGESGGPGTRSGSKRLGAGGQD